MTIYDLKPRFQDLLRPVSDSLAARGVTPNQVTLAALILSVVTGFGIVIIPDAALYALPVVLLVRMALNAIDGMMAREHGMQSIGGMFLNEIGDVVSDLALYIPFFLMLGEPLAWAFVVFLVGIPASEMAGILALIIGGIRRYDGPMGKSDRACAMSALALSIAMFGGNDLITGILVIIVSSLVWWTTLRRYEGALGDQRKVRT